MIGLECSLYAYFPYHSEDLDDFLRHGEVIKYPSLSRVFRGAWYGHGDDDDDEYVDDEYNDDDDDENDPVQWLYGTFINVHLLLMTYYVLLQSQA